MAHTLFEAPVAEDTRLVRAADLDAVREKAIAEVGGPMTFISVHNYGRADARIHVWHAAADGRLGFTQPVFDGADGRPAERRGGNECGSKCIYSVSPYQ